MSQKRKTVIVSFSLPKSLAKNLKEHAKRRGCSRSELIAAALEQHMWLEEWRNLEAYGFEKSVELGREPDDVECLIDDYRQEKDDLKRG